MDQSAAELDVRMKWSLLCVLGLFCKYITDYFSIYMALNKETVFTFFEQENKFENLISATICCFTLPV